MPDVHSRYLVPRGWRSLPAAVLGVVLAALLALPVGAQASVQALYKDCQDNSRLSKTYSAKEYQDALKNIPADLDEYTNCRDIIRRAQLSAAGGGPSGSDSNGAGGDGATGGGTGGSSGGGANSFEAAIAGASPAEKSALEQATSGATPVLVGGRQLRPDSPGALSAGNSLPTSLVVVLVLLALGAAAALAPNAVTRVRRHRAAT